MELYLLYPGASGKYPWSPVQSGAVQLQLSQIFTVVKSVGSHLCQSWGKPQFLQAAAFYLGKRKGFLTGYPLSRTGLPEPAWMGRGAVILVGGEQIWGQGCHWHSPDPLRDHRQAVQSPIFQDHYPLLPCLTKIGCLSCHGLFLLWSICIPLSLTILYSIFPQRATLRKKSASLLAVGWPEADALMVLLVYSTNSRS